jgi:hypothetical protein
MSKDADPGDERSLSRLPEITFRDHQDRSFMLHSFSAFLKVPLAALLLMSIAVHAEESQSGESLRVDNSVYQNQMVRGRVSDRFEIYNPHSEADLLDIRKMGFTQVILDWPNLHAAATGLGLDVVVANWWTIDTETAKVEEAIRIAQSIRRDKLRGISMMDEPERNSPQTPFEFYEALYKDLRTVLDKELTGVRLEMSHWGPLRGWDEQTYQQFVTLYRSADVMRIMPYPDLREGPLSEVFYQMMRSRRIMARAGRELPLVVILQTWVLPEDNKLPTIGELRVMVWQAVLSGAETVSFFSYEPETWKKSPGFTEGFREMMAEFSAWMQLNRNAVFETSIDSQGILNSLITRTDGSRYRMRINTHREPVNDLPGLAIQTWSVFPETFTENTKLHHPEPDGIRQNRCWQFRPHDCTNADCRNRKCRVAR